MKKHTIILIVSLSIFLLFLGAYQLGYGAVISLRQSVEKLDANIRGKQELLARSDTEAETVVSLAKDEDIINRYIVTNISVVKFLNVFEAIGRATGATVSVVSVSKQVKFGKQVYVISINAQGSFSEVMNTVGAIETMPYYITTRMVSISNAQLPGQNQAGKKIRPWSVSMTLSVAAATAAKASVVPSVATHAVSGPIIVASTTPHIIP